MDETFAQTKARGRKIFALLKETHPDAKCALTFRNPFELLVAVILSAQSTDKQVNKVTPELFRLLPTPQAFAVAPLEKIEILIHSIGFHHTKAKNIQGAAKKIWVEFKGEVPKTMPELITLPGVGRKTASVVLETGFGKNIGIAVDTHVMRLTDRLDLISLGARGKPEKIEPELMRMFSRKEWGLLSHTLIFHGRRICHARGPKCHECPVVDLCPGRRL